MASRENLNPFKIAQSQFERAAEVLGLDSGTRKVLSVQELLGMEGPVVTMQEIFHFVSTGIDKEGMIRGYFEATGIVPRCLERLRIAGVDVPVELFERGRKLAGAA